MNSRILLAQELLRFLLTLINAIECIRQNGGYMKFGIFRSINQRGATLVEYSLLCSMIAMVSVSSASFLGTSAQGSFQKVGQSLSGQHLAHHGGGTASTSDNPGTEMGEEVDPDGTASNPNDTVPGTSENPPKDNNGETPL